MGFEKSYGSHMAPICVPYVSHMRRIWVQYGSNMGQYVIPYELLDEDGAPVGWAGGRPSYGGRVWELHPLVVHGTLQGRGIGRALVDDISGLAAARGGETLYVGADDEDGTTSLGGADLYEGLPAQLAAFHSWGDHPAGFYRNLGFAVVGVMPDAGGVGKPDIFLAKRIGAP